MSTSLLIQLLHGYRVDDVVTKVGFDKSPIDDLMSQHLMHCMTRAHTITC